MNFNKRFPVPKTTLHCDEPSMEEVLEIYERRNNPAQPVVCLGEKSVTLHADVRPATAAAPGRETCRDSEYQRCGTANVFCAV